jgi:hypothetical protein
LNQNPPDSHLQSSWGYRLTSDRKFFFIAIFAMKGIAELPAGVYEGEEEGERREG